MSPKKDNSPAIRAKKASDLDRFAQFLTQQNILQDPKPIYNAASACRNHNVKGMWKYSIDNLIFRKLGSIKVFQNEFDVENATIIFSMLAEGKCEPNEGEDPLTALSMNIFLSGNYISGDNINNAYSSWHLDRHNSEIDSAFLHPIYHFSFGGMRLEDELDFNNTPVILADTPRIAHLPMDAILGIDFILTNFWENSLLTYRKEGVYVNLVGESQRTFWKPYIDSLHSFWRGKPDHLLWPPNLIIPQLMEIGW